MIIMIISIRFPLYDLYIYYLLFINISYYHIITIISSLLLPLFQYDYIIIITILSVIITILSSLLPFNMIIH